jgi:hypothetical protein
MRLVCSSTVPNIRDLAWLVVVTPEITIKYILKGILRITLYAYKNKYLFLLFNPSTF